jgi:DNA-binding MarR family transcriptional regulator
MSSRPIFLRFLHLTQAISGEWTASNLDFTALRLLEELAIAHSQGESMTVTEAMNLGFIASPATLHRKLDQLREAGYIDFSFKGTNRRTKFLAPTEIAEKYFENMGKALLTALKPA